jgi:hypothetical protein
MPGLAGPTVVLGGTEELHRNLWKVPPVPPVAPVPPLLRVADGRGGDGRRGGPTRLHFTGLYKTVGPVGPVGLTEKFGAAVGPTAGPGGTGTQILRWPPIGSAFTGSASPRLREANTL